MATRTPSPAQLAARARFAEMARNGSLNRKRQIAAKKRASNPAKKTVSQKISQLVHEGYPQKQAVAVALNEQRAGKVKRNPAKVKYRDLAKDMKAHHVAGYSVHKADRPYYHAVAWFSNKSDAMEVAQDLADRTGAQYAVSKAVTYFGS